jgi:hypothetical protein
LIVIAFISSSAAKALVWMIPAASAPERETSSVSRFELLLPF